MYGTDSFFVMFGSSTCSNCSWRSTFARKDWVVGAAICFEFQKYTRKYWWCIYPVQISVCRRRRGRDGAWDRFHL